MSAVIESPTAALAGGERRLRLSAAQLSLGLSAFILAIGWMMPLDRYITPRSGLGYWLGIIGGSMMLALLIYPARKRIPGLTMIGSPRAWFQIHMVLGVAGPLCVLYHSCYKTGAANSNVALFSMLIVAGSGLIGRYLYGRIHVEMYGRKSSLTDLRADAERLKTEANGAARLLPEFAPRLDAAEKRIGGRVLLVPRPLSALLAFRFERARMRRYVRRTLRAAAIDSRPIRQHCETLAELATRHADARLTAARRVAEFESCERLFGLWHVLHLPLFGMLFVAGIVHVVAVNVY